MVRFVAGSLHALLALGLGAVAAYMLGIALVNTRWEVGFYGATSLGTSAATLWATAALLIAVIEGVCGAGLAAGQRWGAWGVLVIGGLLVMSPNAPAFRIVMALTMFVALRELWPAPAEPEGEG